MSPAVYPATVTAIFPSCLTSLSPRLPRPYSNVPSSQVGIAVYLCGSYQYRKYYRTSNNETDTDEKNCRHKHENVSHQIPCEPSNYRAAQSLLCGPCSTRTTHVTLAVRPHPDLKPRLTGFIEERLLKATIASSIACSQ